MDDLLALFDAAIEQPQQENTPDILSSQQEESNSQQIHHKKRTNIPLKTQEVNQRTSSVDSDLYGIRMINRNISSTDLMNRMIDYPFHGTAQLCAASLSTLNTLLVEPTTILDVATVNGKTHLWTLGIVFTNTGSRVGPSGKAYCMLYIGTFTTGPTVTIMLFGTSYLTYCHTVRSGMVIALINPRLLSPRTAGYGNNKDRTTPSSSTILSFSVSDKEQLLVVGVAQDYGRCKATTSSKNEHGQWIPNSKACGSYVDRRQGDYCHQHRKLQHKSSDVSSKGTISSGKLSAIQQLRTQASAFPLVRSDQMSKAAGNNNSIGIPVKSFAAMNNQIPSTTIPLRAIYMEGQSQQLQQPLQSFQNRYTTHQSKNPLLLEKKSSLGPVSMHSTSNKAVNPYATKKREQHPVQLNAKSKGEPHLVTRNALRTIDILQQPPKRPTNNGVAVPKENKKRRLVNTDTSGFNGSVPIPAPAKIFSLTNGPVTAAVFGHKKQSHSDPVRRTENVIVQQQMIASQLRSTGSIVHLTSHTLQGKAKSLKQTPNDSLFDSHFDSTERENIINAKSQFTSEVEAEEYTRSRRIVCELEEQESKVTSKANTSNQSGTSKTPVILKEWYCHVCKKRFSQEPIRCIRLQHRIKVERDLRAAKTKVEERLAMTEARAEDGGLVLGTGLDWSRFHSSRFS